MDSNECVFRFIIQTRMVKLLFIYFAANETTQGRKKRRRKNKNENQRPLLTTPATIRVKNLNLEML